jgi:hypothetical protein
MSSYPRARSSRHGRRSRLARIAFTLLVLLVVRSAYSQIPTHEDDEAPPGAVASFAPSALDGYAAWPSVRRGEELVLHIAGLQPQCVVRWVHVGASEQVVAEDAVDGLTPPTLPEDAVVGGARIPVALRKRVPSTWAAGLWFARLSEASDATPIRAELPFVVLPAPGEPAARIAVLVPFITAQAYNAWGGASLYPSRYGQRSTRVSMLRPSDPDSPGSVRIQGLPHVIEWMQREGFDVRCVADVDLHADAAALHGVDLLVLLGHHEYWTRAMRQRVAQFVGNGGRLFVLGGNTCYWQIRFETPTTILCAKDARQDPWLRDPPPGGARDVTTQWAWPPVLEPENATFGAAWRHASWATSLDASWAPSGYPFGGVVGRYPLDDGYGGYRVAAPTHWAFEGLDAQALEHFGNEVIPYGGAAIRAIAACGEVDGVHAERIDDRILVSRSSGSPADALVLAAAPAQEGMTAVTIHHGPGTVVNVGSGGWPTLMGHAAGRFTTIETFSRNVLRRLAEPRRNVLLNGGLEDWDGATPAAWTARGASPTGPLAECGTTAVRLDRQGAITQRMRAEPGSSWLVVAAHARGSGTLRVGTTKTRLEATDAARFTGLVAMADEAGFVDIELEATDAPLVLDHIELMPLDAVRAANPATNGRWTQHGGTRALLLVASTQNASPPHVDEMGRSVEVLPAGSAAAWSLYEVRSKRRGALTELVAEVPVSEDAARPELLVVPLDVPSPELDADLDPEDRALVDDAFDNGGFELAPTDAEIDAGRSFALFPPHWAVEPIGAITFDRFAWRGSRSLRFDGTERPASATSPAAELLSIEGAWHARAKVFVDKGATLQLSIAASRVEDPAPRWAELTTRTVPPTEAWMDVDLEVSKDRLAAFTSELGVRGWICVEVQGGKAWIDDVGIAVGAR